MGQRLQVESQTSLQTIAPQDEQTTSASQMGIREGGRATLPSVLCTAMESLDVDLDDELNRYRRYLAAKKFAKKHGRHLSEAAAPTASGNIAGNVPEGQKNQALAIALRPESSLHGAGIAEPSESAPDGYLESSEALLRSLDEPSHSHHLSVDPSVNSHHESGDDSEETGLFASLMTPLGIGSLVLLVLSSATLGYVVMNPALLSRGTEDNPDHSAVFEDASDRTGISPDLSAGEFSELDLHSLSSIPAQQRSSVSDPRLEDENGEDDAAAATDESTLEPSQVEPAPPSNTTVATAPTPGPYAAAPAPVPFSTSSQSPAPQPAPVPAPTPIPAPTVSPQPAPSTPPSTTAASPSTSTASASPSSVAVVASTETSQENYVYVVTPYTGDRSLEQAREAVSGAYVRNFPQGAQVQLGAFSTPERAQSLVQELNSQGIPAQVYSR